MTTKGDILKTIRSYCEECIGEDFTPKDCTSTDCNLYPFREGKDPHPRQLSPRELQARRKGVQKRLAQVKNGPEFQRFGSG